MHAQRTASCVWCPLTHCCCNVLLDLTWRHCCIPTATQPGSGHAVNSPGDDVTCAALCSRPKQPCQHPQWYIATLQFLCVQVIAPMAMWPTIAVSAGNASQAHPASSSAATGALRAPALWTHAMCAARDPGQTSAATAAPNVKCGATRCKLAVSSCRYPSCTVMSDCSNLL